MKKILLFLFVTALTTLSVNAQNSTAARKLLNRAAAIVGNKGGAQASFSISGANITTTSGTLTIKGEKFNARTSKAIVWYDGKTQWTYLKSTNEVNISKPDAAKRMRLNPLTFITMYKSGYNISMTGRGTTKTIRLVAQSKTKNIQEAYITLNSATAIPSRIKMRENKGWITVNISKLRAKAVSNATFVFNAKEFPHAEVVDLR